MAHINSVFYNSSRSISLLKFNYQKNESLIVVLGIL
jgi:hypothetical protein